MSLRETTADTVRAVTKLAVREYQNRFVASNAVSLAQEQFAPEAWYRAIYLSYIPDEGGPEQLYLFLGFRSTGEMGEDEIFMELALG